MLIFFYLLRSPIHAEVKLIIIKNRYHFYNLVIGAKEEEQGKYKNVILLIEPIKTTNSNEMKMVEPIDMLVKLLP